MPESPTSCGGSPFSCRIIKPPNPETPAPPSHDTPPPKYKTGKGEAVKRGFGLEICMAQVQASLLFSSTHHHICMGLVQLLDFQGGSCNPETLYIHGPMTSANRTELHYDIQLDTRKAATTGNLRGCS